jgi:hypothetical protein
MAGYFADVWLSQMTVNPQAQNLIANLDRMTDVAERMATVAEKFPQDVGEVRENLIRQAAEEMNRLSQINIERIAEKVAVERETAIRQFMSDLGKERHKAIQDLVSEEERINRMLADLRQSLEESTRFMAALNLFMEHLAPLVAEEKLAEDPFDINEYAQTATNIGNAAQELDTLAITFKEVLDAPGWQIVLPRIEAAINRAGTEGEELIDHTFKQTALLILLFLVGYVLARLFLDNLKRKQKRS